MIYGYIRVSTDKQTVENQRFEIQNFCKQEKLQVDKWIEETISGNKAVEKRKLGILLRKLYKDDVLICSEISRLGRNLMMIMSILNHCMEREIKVWTIKDNYRLGSDINSKVLAFAFGLSAEIERNLISQRTKEALARKRSEGIKLGRPKGNRAFTNTVSELEIKIDDMIQKRITKSEMARRLNVSRVTIIKYIKAIELSRN